MPIVLEAWTVWTFDAFGMATRAEIYPGHHGAEAMMAAGFLKGAGL
jgi:hypothetical protein